MESSKTRKRKKFKEIMKSKWGGYLVIIFIFLLLICFFPEKNIFTLFSKKIEWRQQNEKIRQLQEDIIRTDQQIHKFTDDPDALETYAREQFHFAKPGEDVYITED